MYTQTHLQEIIKYIEDSKGTAYFIRLFFQQTSDRKNISKKDKHSVYRIKDKETY